MPVKSAFLHLTRIWLEGGRWVMMLAAMVAAGWVLARVQWREFSADAGVRPMSDLEQRQLAMVQETRQDQSPDFSHGVSAPLNNWLPHRTDGVVRPLWPWMTAWLVDDMDASSAKLTPRSATRVHLMKLVFALVVLAVLGLACVRSFSAPAALLSIFLTGFGVLLPTSRWFLPDLLFSTLFLLTWLCCVAALKRNSLWLHGAIGFFSALADLTAPTTVPLVLVFILLSTLRWLWGWITSHFPLEHSTTLWVRRNHWLGIMLLVVCHLFTVGPMLSSAHQQLGTAAPFHWRWFDNADEMRVWSARHHTRDLQRVASADPMPGFDNYRATHTTEQMRGRLLQGALAVAHTVLDCSWRAVCPRGCFAFALAAVLILLLLLLAFVAPRAHHAGQALHPESAPIVLFSVLALVVSAFDIGWDSPVLGAGGRALALYPPLVLSLLWACEALVQRARRRKMRFPIFFTYEVVLWLLCGAAAWWMIAFLQPATSAA